MKSALIFCLAAIIVLNSTGAIADLSLDVEAQELIYIKASAEQTAYVRLTSEGRFVSALPAPPGCWVFSNDGKYLALSSLEPDTLTIVQSDTMHPFLVEDWQPEWRPCSMLWLTDDILSLGRSDIVNNSLRYDISSGSLIPVSSSLDLRTLIPPVPELYQWRTRPTWVLPSPQANLFLYQRCVNQEFLASDQREQRCPCGVDAVIYDAANAAQVASLPRWSSELAGYEITTERLLATPGASWSFDGQLLAYRFIPENVFQAFDLAIFDLATNTTLNLNALNETIDYTVSLDWSPEAYKLLFWVKGRYGEDQEGEEQNISPVIYDADFDMIIPSDLTFQLPADYFGNPVTWSPDGRALVFINADQDLIQLDTRTGSTTVLDTQVLRIIAWNETIRLSS